MNNARIVVVGAHVQSLFMHVERIPAKGETVLGRGFDVPDDGGKATNQAVAAARLGASVALVSMVGTDPYGDRALALLRAEGVDTRYVERRSGPTDVGFVMLGPDGIPAITTSSDLNGAFDGPFVDGAREMISTAALVVCQLEAPIEAALAAFRIARATGATTVLNPAPAGAVPQELFDLTDVLIPNEHEAAELLGGRSEAELLAVKLRDRSGVDTVIVTAGAHGAWVADVDGQHLEPAAIVEVADTTGAGDAFVGAFAWRLAAGDRVGMAVRVAVAAAGVSVMRPGTIPSFAAAADLPAGHRPPISDPQEDPR